MEQGLESTEQNNDIGKFKKPLVPVEIAFTKNDNCHIIGIDFTLALEYILKMQIVVLDNSTEAYIIGHVISYA